METETGILGNVAAALEGAAELIRMNGLHKGAFWPKTRGNVWGHSPVTYVPGSPVCILGGLLAVESDPMVRSFATDALRREHEWVNGQLSVWNDNPETTADDVVELLLRAAKTVRNEA